MKTLINLIIFFAITGRFQAAGTDGVFLFSNQTAPTRIGTSNGPLAGPGIWAQMLVSTNTESLTPIGTPLEHGGFGLVPGRTISVAGIEGGTFVYVQMAAWNGAVWGTSINDVPADQFGRTDVVPMVLSYDFQPSFTPMFTQPAIVPIPEPSTVALAAVGAGMLWCATRRRRKSSA